MFLIDELVVSWLFFFLLNHIGWSFPRYRYLWGFTAVVERVIVQCIISFSEAFHPCSLRILRSNAVIERVIVQCIVSSSEAFHPGSFRI